MGIRNKILLNTAIYILLGCWSNHIKAQNKLPVLSINNIGDIKAYISESYRPDEKFIATACINSVIYVKFKISNSNKIDSLDISANGPQEIKAALKRAILTTNGHWSLTEEEKKQMVNKSFILPFAFNYQAGCSSGVILQQHDPKMDEYRNKMKNLNAEISKSVNNMLKFESGSYSIINCILISPMVVGSLN